MGDTLPSGEDLRKMGYKPAWEEYPPFQKNISVYFADQVITRIGTFVVSGGDNRMCLYCDDGKYYDLDNYIAYWKVI